MEDETLPGVTPSIEVSRSGNKAKIIIAGRDYLLNVSELDTLKQSVISLYNDIIKHRPAQSEFDTVTFRFKDY